MSTVTADMLRAFYDAMVAACGPQHWWPARTPSEVIVGAILTQNTAWRNVERAIDNLRTADAHRHVPERQSADAHVTRHQRDPRAFPFVNVEDAATTIPEGLTAVVPFST